MSTTKNCNTYSPNVFSTFSIPIFRKKSESSEMNVT